MAELLIDFRSFEEWNNWALSNKKNFPNWRDESLAVIKREGLEEPLTHFHRPAEELVINEANLRESIRHNGLNSRKRAGLYGLELSLEQLSDIQRLKPRIISAEALTAPARILSYKFPFFMGTEYLPTAEKQKDFFPIRHLDIEKIDIPPESFDVFYSGDVFEYFPHIQKSLSQVWSVLKPGGILISTFRFMPNMPTNQVRAELTENGSVRHILPPQHQPNRLNPKESDLVYILPGWEIIDLAKQAGFEDAKLTYIISARHGILNSANPGVFVFSAIKSNPGTERHYLRTRHNPTDITDQKPPNKLIGLLGLPRSGTTMLTSIFSVHPLINSVYEPWNSRKKYLIDNVCLQTFYNVLVETYEPGKSVLFVKETSTKPAYVQRIKRLMDSVDSPRDRGFIALFRNPFHIYLSEIEARVNWWGNAEATVSVETFDAWAVRSIRSVFRMLKLVERYSGILVSYEYLTNHPKESVLKLMDYLDMVMDEKQLNFQDHIDINKVRGDPKLINTLSGVNRERQMSRDSQLQDTDELISQSQYYRDICKLGKFVEALSREGVVKSSNFRHRLDIEPAAYQPI